MSIKLFEQKTIWLKRTCGFRSLLRLDGAIVIDEGSASYFSNKRDAGRRSCWQAAIQATRIEAVSLVWDGFFVHLYLKLKNL